MWILIVLFIWLSCLVSSFSDFSLCFITKFNMICLIKSEPSLCSVPSLMFHIKTFWPRGMYVIFAGWFPMHCWEKRYFFLLPKTEIFLEYLIESVKVQFLSKINPNRFRCLKNIIFFILSLFFSLSHVCTPECLNGIFFDFQELKLWMGANQVKPIIPV